jgi:hypothetical protein
MSFSVSDDLTYSIQKEFGMAWVELEGMFLNTDDIEAVRPADKNDEGFQTELVMVAGMQLLKMMPKEAAKIIAGVK